MGFVGEWLEGTARPSVVKREFSSDNSAYVECTVEANTTFNWSYTFTVSEKIGPSPKRSLGSWSINKQNYRNRASIEAQIEQTYDDAASQLQTSEERAEEEEEQQPSESTTTVREEVVGGITITMTRTENTLDMRGGEDAVYYTVSNTSPTNTARIFDRQEDAEELFDYQVDFYTPKPQTSTAYQAEYRGVNIRFQDTNMPDGSDFISETTNQSMDAVYLTGAITEEFPLGSEVSFIDTYGTQTFGNISGDEEEDLTILEAYIDARLEPRQDPEAPVVPYGELPVKSWGWYDSNPDSDLNPFSKVALENVYTVSGTDGRILVLDDDDFIAQGFNSGLVKLVVKPNYRVQLKLMLQRKGYLEDYLPNHTSYSFETYDEADSTDDLTNYVDTEKVKIDLYGGDVVELNIDALKSDPSYDNFKITQNGQLITRGGAPKINDEVFLAVIQVERYPPEEGGGGGGDTTTTSTGNAIPIIVGGVLILTILYMVLARGDGE